MSNKEKCISILNSFTDSQLVNILSILEAARNVVITTEDDVFCEKLYTQYESDSEKDISFTEDEVLKELGIAL